MELGSGGHAELPGGRPAAGRRRPEVPRLVADAGLPRVPVARESHFATLVRSIVHRQLATAAARAIHGRVIAAPGGEVTPRRLLATPDAVPRRMDVRPTGDLAVRTGYGLAWRVPAPTERQLVPLGEPYRPYRSVVAGTAGGPSGCTPTARMPRGCFSFVPVAVG